MASNAFPISLSTRSFYVTTTVDALTLATAPVREILTPTGALTDSTVQLDAEIGRTGLQAYATISGTQELGGSPVEIEEIDFQVVTRPAGSLRRV
jgi:hypothetical protein